MMVGMRGGAFALIGLCAVAGTERAQPGNAPPPPPPVYAPPPPPPGYPVPPPASGPVAGEKSPGVALALSLGGTVGCVALGGLADTTGNDGLATAGGLCLWVAPSFGHWYAGTWWTTGMTLRTAALGGLVVGAALLFDECVNDEVGCDEGISTAVLLGAAFTFIGGIVYDVATAPGAARKHNRRLRERAAYGWTLAPVVTPDRAGFVLRTRF
jgi:MFS family permease